MLALLSGPFSLETQNYKNSNNTFRMPKIGLFLMENSGVKILYKNM